MDVELRLISKVLKDKDIRPCLDAKVRPEFFLDDEHSTVWRWVLDYYTRHGACPTASALKRNYPAFKLAAETGEALSWYIEQLMQAREYALFYDAMAEAEIHMKAKDAGSARAVIQACLGQLAEEMSPLRDINLSDPEYIAKWKAEYEELESYDGALRGLPTGFPTIDRATSGLRPEQLITMVGLPKAGKSTALLLMYKAVHDYGRRPLFIGFEMSNEEQRNRYAAIRASVDFHRLDRGTLKVDEKKRFYKALNELENTPDLWFTADPSATSTVSGILGKVETYEPSAVFIDGVYLMQDEVSGEQNTSTALTNITRALKRMAQRYQIPVVCTTQVLAWKMNKKRGITADSIGYTSSFAQDSDVILGLEEVEGEDDQRKLRVVSARNLKNRVVLLQWSWETNMFEEMESYDPDADEEDDGTL